MADIITWAVFIAVLVAIWMVAGRFSARRDPALDDRPAGDHVEDRGVI
jgi:hypothetical protein